MVVIRVVVGDCPTRRWKKAVDFLSQPPVSSSGCERANRRPFFQRCQAVSLPVANGRSAVER